VVCFDRGLVSDENLKLLARKQIHFVTVLDRSQLGHFDDVIDHELLQQVRAYEVTTQTEAIRSLLTRHHFHEARQNLFYHRLTFAEAQQRTIETKTATLHMTTRRYFLAFNPELAARVQRHRQQRVAAFSEWIEAYNGELAQALGDRSQAVVEKTITQQLKRQRLTDVPISYTLHPYTVTNRNAHGTLKQARTYRITVNEVTSQDYTQSRTHDGIWILVTNLSALDEAALFHQTDLDSCVEIYRLRQRIEESFRILSDVVEIEPFHVYTTAHIKAHVTICILAYVLDLTMLRRIRNANEVDNMDLHRLWHLLGKCRQDCIQLDDTHVVSRITQLTDEQHIILKVLECQEVVAPEYLQRYHIVSDLAADYKKRA
jgi:transposase